MADNICSGFEPQNYLKDRCKKCFRLKSKHESGPSNLNNNKLNNNKSIQSSSTTRPSFVNIRNNNVKTTQKETNNNNQQREFNLSTKIERRKSWRDKTLTPNSKLNKNNNDESGPDFEGLKKSNKVFN